MCVRMCVHAHGCVRSRVRVCMQRVCVGVLVSIGSVMKRKIIEIPYLGADMTPNINLFTLSHPYAHTYTHIHTHTNIHTHTHAYTDMITQHIPTPTQTKDCCFASSRTQGACTLHLGSPQHVEYMNSYIITLFTSPLKYTISPLCAVCCIAVSQ